MAKLTQNYKWSKWKVKDVHITIIIFFIIICEMLLVNLQLLQLLQDVMTEPQK